MNTTHQIDTATTIPDSPTLELFTLPVKLGAIDLGRLHFTTPDGPDMHEWDYSDPELQHDMCISDDATTQLVAVGCVPNDLALLTVVWDISDADHPNSAHIVAARRL